MRSHRRSRALAHHADLVNKGIRSGKTKEEIRQETINSDAEAKEKYWKKYAEKYGKAAAVKAYRGLRYRIPFIGKLARPKN